MVRRSRPSFAATGQQKGEGGRRVAVALFPRHDGISDMARYVGWQFLGAGLKAQADAAAEFAIPDPEQAGDQRPRRRAPLRNPTGFPDPAVAGRRRALLYLQMAFRT